MIPETSALQAIALAGQGQNVSEIARHLGHDRKTIRIYLNGHRAPGQPRPHADSFAPFAAYVRQRAADDPHLRGDGPAPRGHRPRLRRQLLRVHPRAARPRHHRRLRNLQEMEAHSSRAGAGALSRAAPVPHRPARRRDHRLLPRTGGRRQPPAAPAPSPTAAPLVRRPGRRLRRPRRHRPAAARRHQAPGRAHRDQRNRPAARAPRARRARRAPARPRDLPPASAAPPGTGSATRSPSTFPLTSGPADGTAPGSAASSRSTSPRPRTSPPPARKRPSSPASTASPGSCSPRPPPARTRPEARMPGDALRRSPWPAPASTPGTRTRPKQRPTPRQSKQRQRSSARQARCPAGRNNCQNLARTTWRANSYVTTEPAFLTIKKAHAGQRGWIGPRYLSPDTGSSAYPRWT